MRKERMKQAATDGSDSTILDSRGDGGKLESALTRETVEKLAYQYWLDRGCPEGSAAEDWLQAERTLLADRGENRAAGNHRYFGGARKRCSHPRSGR